MIKKKKKSLCVFAVIQETKIVEAVEEEKEKKKRNTNIYVEDRKLKKLLCIY